MQGGQQRGPINGLDPLVYTGGLPNLVVMARQPTPKDYHGFFLGHWWIVPQTNDGSTPEKEIWILVGKQNHIATWKRLHGGGGPTNTLIVGNQILTTPGAGTYTPTSGMKQAYVECLGGGSGGYGLSNDGSGNISTGPGGSSSGYCARLYTSEEIGTSQPYVIGTGGAGGNASFPVGNPGPGVNTTFGAGSTLMTAGGGTVSPGAPIGGVATGGNLNINGQNGAEAISIVISETGFTEDIVFPALGANTMYGFGGVPYRSQGGQNATGYGSGGSSAGSGTGGAGAQGIIKVTEYFA